MSRLIERIPRKSQVYQVASISLLISVSGMYQRIFFCFSCAPFNLYSLALCVKSLAHALIKIKQLEIYAFDSKLCIEKHNGPEKRRSSYQTFRIAILALTLLMDGNDRMYETRNFAAFSFNLLEVAATFRV